MDVFSDVLKKVKLSSAVYFKSNFSSPWGMDIPKGPFAQFHIVTRGQCILKTKDKSIQLFAGDIVVFPLGTNHWLADLETSKRQNGQDVVRAILKGKPLFEGDNIATTLLCGHFEFDRSIEHPFIKEMPKIIHIPDAEKKEFSWLENIVNLVIHEAGNEQPGSQVIVDKLGEVLFIHTLRAYIQRNKAKKGFVAAMQDERIGKVLKAIHSAPEMNWRLVSLARIAGMSRTSFSNQFRDLMGETPLNYITQWRMLQAKELLIESNKPVGEIANEVGYQSEAAFNRVFKKRVTLTPLKFRQSF
ncbi:AraC family transcriptional regulator [Aquimarina macrocephali]|uniref:AraC family transcriptional regulator n=1 Tax=Aquimarina macrocephali TaxID=666563 RepID=UPI0004645192|nr:AraC family transcriptional regulator [Aquimarina macrocephali]